VGGIKPKSRSSVHTQGPQAKGGGGRESPDAGPLVSTLSHQMIIIFITENGVFSSSCSFSFLLPVFWPQKCYLKNEKHHWKNFLFNKNVILNLKKKWCSKLFSQRTLQVSAVWY